MVPTANARLPLASSASFGRNGAPAAQPSSRSPTPNGSSSRSTFASATAPTGIKTKLASKARSTSGSFGEDRAVSPLLHLVLEESSFGDGHCRRFSPVFLLHA